MDTLYKRRSLERLETEMSANPDSIRHIVLRLLPMNLAAQSIEVPDSRRARLSKPKDKISKVFNPLSKNILREMFHLFTLQQKNF